MKIILRAAIAILSLGIGSADAGDGDSNSVTTLFTPDPEQAGYTCSQCGGRASN